MSEFRSIIEWSDETGEAIVHRYPEQGSADIKFGSQLIVRENQAAIFVRDGKGLDVLGPGRHVLTTQNLPIITKVLSLPYGFKSPFRAEVYFINLKVFLNMRWGTKDPVAFRDAQLGLVRLRAFGTFTMQVTQPLLFLNTVVGTQGKFGTADVEDYLREVIVSRLNDFLGETVHTLFDLPQYYEEMAVAVKTRLTDDFRKYGLELVDFFINRITPPEEVQKMIDEKSGMQAVGDLDRFLQYKAAKALGDAAQGGAIGSASSATLGAGVGAGMGMLIPGMLVKALEGRSGSGASRAASCPACHGEVASDSRFCAHCGRQLVVIQKCPGCSENLAENARFCPSCGMSTSAELHCRSCNARLPQGTRFCTACGEKLAPALLGS